MQVNERLGCSVILVALDQAGIAVIVEHGAVEGVGARTQDQVQRAAGEIAFFHIGRHGLDRQLFDGFQRHRAAVGRQAAGVQAEIVMRAHAVNGDAVGAWRGTGDIQPARRTGAARGWIQLGQRVATGGFADIALDGDDAVDLVAAQLGARAGTGLRDRAALAGDDNGRRRFEGNVQLGLVAQCQIDFGGLAVIVTAGRDHHCVRAADLQPGSPVTALAVGAADIGRA